MNCNPLSLLDVVDLNSGPIKTVPFGDSISKRALGIVVPIPTN